MLGLPNFSCADFTYETRTGTYETRTANNDTAYRDVYLGTSLLGYLVVNFTINWEKPLQN
jgi:hypothetical protein